MTKYGLKGRQLSLTDQIFKIAFTISVLLGLSNGLKLPLQNYDLLVSPFATQLHVKSDLDQGIKFADSLAFTIVPNTCITVIWLDFLDELPWTLPSEFITLDVGLGEPMTIEGVFQDITINNQNNKLSDDDFFNVTMKAFITTRDHVISEHIKAILGVSPCGPPYDEEAAGPPINYDSMSFYRQLANNMTKMNASITELNSMEWVLSPMKNNSAQAYANNGILYINEPP